jgi:phosphate transport system protein
VRDYFVEMGRIAVNIGHDAKDVVLSRNPETAGKFGHDDDAMDDLHRHLFTVAMDHQWSHPVATAVDITLLSRYYEQFVDHACASIQAGRARISC